MRNKGSNAERELLTMLWGVNYAAIRAAGSGVQRFYSPDLLASNGSKILAIECKATKKDQQYFDTEQIRQLKEFARIFGAVPWLAVKFSTSWRFFKPDELKQTKKAFVIKSTDEGKFFGDM